MTPPRGNRPVALAKLVAAIVAAAAGSAAEALLKPVAEEHPLDRRR